jgi:flagellar motility protein MotE (MotC chaperone)
VKSVRLLPVVVAAVAALLLFKAIGIATGGGYLFEGEEAVAAGAPADDHAAPANEHAAPSAAADHGAVGAPPPSGTSVTTSDVPLEDGMPMEVGPTGDLVPFGAGGMITETERQILTSLADRRTQLDARAADLDMRQAVVEAAEMRLQQRIDELTALEAEINALLAQFAGLIAMYEAMRPADAAAIFNRLEIDVLTRVATAMSPRKMSPILAAMAPERAEVLTIRLASIEPEPMRNPAATGLEALPQIVGQ